MSTIQTFIFRSMGGVIPDIPGGFSAGTAVDVNMDTMTVIAQHPLSLPPDVPATSTPEPVTPLVTDESEEVAQDAPQER